MVSEWEAGGVKRPFFKPIVLSQPSSMRLDRKPSGGETTLGRFFTLWPVCTLTQAPRRSLTDFENIFTVRWSAIRLVHTPAPPIFDIQAILSARVGP